MDNYLKVGIISSVHGVHGQVKVFPTTDDIKRFKKLKSIYFLCNNTYVEYEIDSVQFFKNMVIIKFKAFSTPEEIAKYKGTELYVDRKNAVSLAKDEYFIADLIDMEAVSDDGKYKGVVYDVYQTGANDVYCIKLEDGQDIMLPAIKECILCVDIENHLLTFHVMEGLL